MTRRIFTSKEEFLIQNDSLGTSLPYSDSTKVLGEAVQLGPKTAPNRLACQAMEGCDGTPDGSPDELTMRRYRRFAEGGAGVIWFEATACREDGRANPRQLWLHDGNLDDFKRAADMIRGRKIALGDLLQC